MSLLVPDTGLLFWMILSFSLVFIILAKFGFPAITKMVEERREYISRSLEVAKEANTQLVNIKAEAEDILLSARREQVVILNEAAALREELIKEAKEKALGEGAKQLETVRRQIQTEKEDAIRDIRTQVAILSIEVAEKILREKLTSEEQQMQLIYRLMDEVDAKKS